MRKIITLGIMLLFLGMTISSSGFNLEKQSIKPLSFGNTLYVGGSGPNNYTKIQDAIDNASNGDTVFVYDDSSPYYENVIVYKSIDLVGESKESTIIDGQRTGIVIHVTVSDVEIEGFTIQLSGRTGTYGNMSGVCIGYMVRNVTIYDNIVSDNLKGIYIYSWASNISIKNNLISYNWMWGIQLWGPNTNMTIEGNIIENNFIGIHGLGTVKYNIIISKNIINNEDIFNDEFGITLIGYGCLISENNIERQNRGLWLIGLNNTISNNNFINNSRHAIIEVNPSDEPSNNKRNRWIGNYWGRPRILPKPIFGGRRVDILKIPFSIPWLNFDWHPAKEPYDIGV